MDEIRNTKYAHLAETYDFIALFPSTDAGDSGCWNVGWRADNNDLMEDTATGHLTYDNQQAVALKNMVDALLAGENGGNNGGNDGGDNGTTNADDNNSTTSSAQTTTTQASTTTTAASGGFSHNCAAGEDSACPSGSDACWVDFWCVCYQYCDDKDRK